MNVLIVDDQPSNLKLLRAVLEGEGMEVNEATDGVDALATLRRGPAVDAIVSDVAMPRMDGFRFCMELRRSEQFSRVPFIAYTASYTSASDEKLMTAIGADRFLRKPTPVSLLVRTIVETVGEGRENASKTHARSEPELLVHYGERLAAKLVEKNRALTDRLDSLTQAEAELRVAHQRLHQVINQSPAVIYVLKVEGDRFVPKIASENLTRLLGFTLEEALSYEWWLAQLHPDDRDRAIASLTETMVQGASRIEYRLRHKDGSMRWVDDHRRIICDASGKPSEIFGVWMNITQRKQAEIELNEHREQWRMLVSTSNDGILVVQDELIAFANPALARILGAPGPEAILGRPALDLLDPDFRRSGRNRLREALTRSEPLPPAEEKIRRLDGGIVAVESSFVRIQFHGRSGVLLNFRDITERKRAERRKRLQHAVNRAVAESVSLQDTISRILETLSVEMGWDFGEYWALDRGTKMLRCMETWTLNNSDRSEFVSASRNLACRPGVGLAGHVWESGEPLWFADLEHVRNCPRRDMAIGLGFRSWLGFPVRSSGEITGVVGFFGTTLQPADSEMTAVLADVGVQIGQRIEQQRLADQFRQAQKMDALGTLAGGIAHDFNNVLAAITGYSELAKLEASVDSSQHRYLEGVLTGARRATALVRQILAFCRRHEQPRQPMQLHHTVREALELLRAAVPADVAFETSISKDAPIVLADATQVHQVVMNLCTNAVHAMRERGGKLTVILDSCIADTGLALETPGLRPGRYARLTVTDTGLGMDENTRQQIFEPFFTTKPAGEGTGLGLAVVHGIVRSHEGAIGVFSLPGHGSTFHVYFPANGCVTGENLVSAGGRPRGNGQRVLLVDDEPAIVYVSRRALELLGYRVQVFSEPEKALEFIANNPNGSDVMITDLVMPGISGRELARRVSALRPGYPIIATTGNTARVNLDELKTDGIAEVVAKPVSIDELATVVNRALKKTAPL